MIRKLKESDCEEIKRILADTNHFSEEEIKIALELIAANLNGSEDYNIYVYNDSKVLGYICYGKRPMTEGAYDLYWIAVHPDSHGSGIGKKLVQFMEDELRKVNARLVITETSGQESYGGERTFYEKNDYSVQTVIKDFYKQGDDLVVYCKYLN